MTTRMIASVLAGTFLAACVTTIPAGPPTPDQVASYLADERRLATERLTEWFTPDHRNPRLVYAPDVRLGFSTTAEQAESVRRALEILNASLPRPFRFSLESLDGNRVPNCFRDECLPRKGQIFLHFLEFKYWPRGLREMAKEQANQELRGQSRILGIGGPLSFEPTAPSRLESGFVYIDHERVAESDDDTLVKVIVHELMHILGRTHLSPSKYPHTIMNLRAPERPPHYLYPLDVAVLREVYGEQEHGR